MRARDSKATLRKRLKALGSSPLKPKQVFECMLAFYRDTRAADCNGPDSDMLLYQFGTYDWGRGRHFELDLTRQFIVDHEEDDDAIFQLRATFHLPPSAELDAFGAANHWCNELENVGAFTDFIAASPPYAALARRTDAKLVLDYENAG